MFVKMRMGGIIIFILFMVIILVMVKNMVISFFWKIFLWGLVAIVLGCDLLILLISNFIIF